MKNVWLDRRGPAKTKINVWVCASIADGDKEELVEESEIETTFLRSSAITHRFISEGTDETLCLLRVGKEVVRTGGLAEYKDNTTMQAIEHRSQQTQWFTKGEWSASIAASNKQISEWEATKAKELTNPATTLVKSKEKK